MGGIATAVKKELKTAFRDRRILFSTIIVPLIFPFFMFLPAYFIGKKTERAREKPTRVVILNEETFKGIRDSLNRYGLFTFMESEDPIEKLCEGKLDAVIHLERKDTLTLLATITFDPKRLKSRVGFEKLKAALLSLSRSVLKKRLRELDIPVSWVNPIEIKGNSLTSEREIGGEIVAFFLSVMIAIGAYSGGIAPALDGTAGEKERKTLESLLSLPVKRETIVMGKFLSTTIVALISVTLMLTVFGLLGTYFLPFILESEKTPSLVLLSPNIPVVLLVILLTITTVVGLMLSIGIFARSYREAQNYLAPLGIVIAIPIIFTRVFPPNPPYWVDLIPILNTILSIKRYLLGKLTLETSLRPLISNLFYTYLTLSLAFKMFKKEQVILR
jgi:sodium transport system permease protein